MRMDFGFLALVGILAFVLLLMADREKKAGVERLSRHNTVPHATLDDDHGLRQQTARGPYMRNERY